MCQGIGCVKKEMCLRYRAFPEKFMQSYAGFDPGADGKSCAHFIDCTGKVVRGVRDVELSRVGQTVKPPVS